MKTIVINLQGGNMTNPNHPKVDQSDRVVPINLRQSGRTPTELLISTRVRKSPFWHLSHEAGCWEQQFTTVFIIQEDM